MKGSSKRTLVVLQPGYIPWLGFFEQMRRADVFVYYDDVQFDKHGWRNRNRIKAPSGVPHWLSVPVLHKGFPKICDVRIDYTQRWQKKHVDTLKQFYAKAPYISRYLPELESLLARHWELLVDMNAAITDVICQWLGIKSYIVRSSSLQIEGDRSERLCNLCRHFAATHYFSGQAAREYLDGALFADNGIEVEFQDYQHPTYSQLHGPFVPYLSVIDLLMNCGDDSRKILATCESG